MRSSKDLLLDGTLTALKCGAALLALWLSIYVFGCIGHFVSDENRLFAFFPAVLIILLLLDSLSLCLWVVILKRLKPRLTLEDFLKIGLPKRGIAIFYKIIQISYEHL